MCKALKERKGFISLGNGEKLRIMSLKIWQETNIGRWVDNRIHKP